MWLVHYKKGRGGFNIFVFKGFRSSSGLPISNFRESSSSSSTSTTLECSGFWEWVWEWICITSSSFSSLLVLGFSSPPLSHHIVLGAKWGEKTEFNYQLRKEVQSGTRILHWQKKASLLIIGEASLIPWYLAPHEKLNHVFVNFTRNGLYDLFNHHYHNL